MKGSLPRTNLWTVPTLCVLAALVLFMASQALDRAHHVGGLVLPRWLNQGGASDARDLLSATAGAIITTLGLILSITVLTLSIAATQFGQRMLRRYMRDRGTQVSIGVFAATFVFTLLTLLSVTSRMEQHEYVPWLSIWLSVALAISCIGILIFFVHHVAETIQVHRVVSDIASELRYLIAFVPRESGNLDFTPARQPDFQLRAARTGYLRHIDYNALAKMAAARSLVIQMLRRPGHFVLEGTPLASVTFDSASSVFASSEHELNAIFHKTLSIGANRSLRQDPEFAIDQLVEIALRAMSPGINDPFTMYSCVAWLTDCLRFIAHMPPERRVYTGAHSQPRVIAVTNSFDQSVHRAFNPLRSVTNTSQGACMNLLSAISALAEHLRHGQTGELRRQAELLRAGYQDLGISYDRADVEQAYQHAMRMLLQAEDTTVEQERASA